MKKHTFASTGQAYDACQCDQDVKKGDILLIPDENVVGIADTWPFAISKEHGQLHGLEEGYTPEGEYPQYAASIAEARRIISEIEEN